MRPFPDVFIGGANKGLVAEAFCQVIDPSRRSACFHDNEVDFVFPEESLKVIPFGSGVEEGMFTSF